MWGRRKVAPRTNLSDGVSAAERLLISEGHLGSMGKSGQCLVGGGLRSEGGV